MFHVRRIILGMASVALVAAAGCATTSTSQDNLSSSANQLATNARVFAKNTSDAPGPGPSDGSYARDVQQLADDAQNFSQAASGRSATDSDVRSAFDQLSRSFAVVRNDMDGIDGSEWIKQNWHVLAQAYNNVAREMGS
jgi:hypothetical protein